LDPSSLSAVASGSKRWGNTTKKPKKNKFWNRLKSGLGLGGGSSSGSDGAECLRCGKLHKGVCRFGTTACFRCGQEGHMARECPRAPFMAQSQETASGSMAQPAAPAMTQGSGRGREEGQPLL